MKLFETINQFKLLQQQHLFNCQHSTTAWISQQRRRKEAWDGRKTTGSGDGSTPAGSRGGAPVGGLEDEVPPEAEEFLK